MTYELVGWWREVERQRRLGIMLFRRRVTPVTHFPLSLLFDPQDLRGGGGVEMEA